MLRGVAGHRPKESGWHRGISCPSLSPREAETAATLCHGIFTQRCSETSQIDADPEEVCEGGEL